MSQPITTSELSKHIKTAVSGEMDICGYLEKNDISYIVEGNYIFLTKPNETHQFELYITIIKTQIDDLLKIILPIIANSPIPIRLPANKILFNKQLSGHLGVFEIGKAITAYFENEEDAKIFANLVVEKMPGFNGPAVSGVPQYAKNIYGPINSRNKLSQPIVPKKPKNNFKPTQTLKNDVKGMVVKGYLIKGFLNFCTCILKQGKRYMWSDEHGRDMHHRLNWQYQIHEDLKGSIKLPNVYLYRENIDETLLIMQFIKGKALLYEIADLYKGKGWLSIQDNTKLILISLFDKVLKIVNTLHQKNYVHRDLNALNFILKNNGDLYIIDFEMAFNTAKRFPLPPFGLGTPGYMSPEQMASLNPTFAEDIYGLGGLMITLFTNMAPIKFNQQDIEVLTKQLTWFIGDNTIAELITSCFNQQPHLRPSIIYIQQQLSIFRSKVENKRNTSISSEFNINPIEVNNLMDRVYKSFTSAPMNEKGMLFGAMQPTKPGVGSSGTIAFMEGGITRNVFGLLFLLGTNSIKRPELITFLKDKLIVFYNQLIPPIDANKPGLFFGAAGNALAIYYSQKSGIIEQSEEINYYIEHCFSLSTSELTLVTGIAGQVLALSLMKNQLNEKFTSMTLATLTSKMLDNQSSNGSWPIYTSSKKLTLGLVDGQSGLIYSLLIYYRKYQDETSKRAIIKGLNFLVKQSVYKRNKRTWPSTSYKSITKDLGLFNGLSGIALTFLLAYEAISDPVYIDIAESILNNVPDNLVMSDYSLHSGMAGIGITLLNMSKFSSNPKWKVSATWIYHVFCNSVQYIQDEKCIWNTKETVGHDPNFFTGYSGIVFFMEQFNLLNNKIIN